MTTGFDAFTADPEVPECLGEVCDFHLDAGHDEPPWYTVDGPERLAVIARDGSGGHFTVMSPSGRVLYASSEGQAGVIAADCDELVVIMVAFPFWRDLLKFSGGGRLDEMRRAAPALENIACHDEDYHAVLKAKLGLPEDADPVGRLHHAVSTSDVVVRAPDGSPAESLFNTFTIDSNPMLKRLAE